MRQTFIIHTLNSYILPGFRSFSSVRKKIPFAVRRIYEQHVSINIAGGMIRFDIEPIAAETIFGPGSNGVVSIARATVCHAGVTGRNNSVVCAGIARTEVNSNNRWFKLAVFLLRSGV